MVHCGNAAMSWARARDTARELGACHATVAAHSAPLAEALGATLGAELTALVGVPPYDASAMDGYAVAGPGPWRVLGRVLAGSAASVASLRPGEAVEIATGAPVPEGAVSVLPYELARVEDGRVSGHIESGRHVRRSGEDTRVGDAVLPAGTAVTPAVLGLAASLGHDTLPVRRPRIAAVVTGDEIAESGHPGPGQVRDAIGPMLPGLAAWSGATLETVSRLGDGYRAMLGALRSAADQPETDAIVVCGASSQGPADHLRAALAELGATVAVDGVACRPGHPQLLAHLGSAQDPGTVIVGLPGNPNAALVAAMTLLVPVLGAMAGRADLTAALPRTLPVFGDIRPHHRDTRLIAVRVVEERAEPVGHDRPGILRGASMADAYAVIPPDWSGPGVELVWLPR